MKKHKIYQILPVAVFLVLVYGMTAWSMLKPDQEQSVSENRYLQQKPDFTLKALFDGSFGKTYETYLSDQFQMRDGFIALKSKTENALHKSDINDVYICKDDYLIRKYQDSSFDQAQVNKNVDALGTFVTHYANLLGTDHVKAMIIPSAAMILKDKLPAFAAPYDETKIVSQIKAKIPENTLIDPTKELSEHKNEYIYYKTDHHWTALGAYYGYEAWAKATGTHPIGLDEYQKQTFTNAFYGTNHSKLCFAKSADTVDLYKYKGDITYKVQYDKLFSQGENKKKQSDTLYVDSHIKDKDKYQVYLDGNHPIVDIKTSNKNGKKLLIVKDSYSHCLVPYLVNHYEEVTMIDTRYYHNPLKTLEPEKNYTDILVVRNTLQFMQDDSVFLMSAGLKK